MKICATCLGIATITVVFPLPQFSAFSDITYWGSAATCGGTIFPTFPRIHFTEHSNIYWVYRSTVATIWVSCWCKFTIFRLGSLALLGLQYIIIGGKRDANRERTRTILLLGGSLCDKRMELDINMKVFLIPMWFHWQF